MTMLDALALDELDAARLLEALGAAARTAGDDPDALAALAVLVLVTGRHVVAWAGTSPNPRPPAVDYLVALGELAQWAGDDGARLDALGDAVRTLAECAALAARARRAD